MKLLPMEHLVVSVSPITSREKLLNIYSDPNSWISRKDFYFNKGYMNTEKMAVGMLWTEFCSAQGVWSRPCCFRGCWAPNLFAEEWLHWPQLLTQGSMNSSAEGRYFRSSQKIPIFRVCVFPKTVLGMLLQKEVPSARDLCPNQDWAQSITTDIGWVSG